MKRGERMEKRINKKGKERKENKVAIKNSFDDDKNMKRGQKTIKKGKQKKSKDEKGKKENKKANRKKNTK